MNNMSALAFLAFVALFSLVFDVPSIEAYPSFRNVIPNGINVPHSCNRSVTWQGVGHESHRGSGPLNPFGRDFMAAEFKWTKALCELDSDGDGKRNGAELGDPNCVWTSGSPPAVTNMADLSHPGVCEPLNTPACQEKNSFLIDDTYCQASAVVNKTDWCPAILAKGVKKIVLRFNETTVSSNDTSYMCQEFSLPADDDYQIIAWEPFISNVEIMHHLVSFVCDKPNEYRQLQTMKDHYKMPVLCPMSPVCTSFSLTWAFGVPSRCYNEEAGVPFGKNYYNKTILQIHYNNQERKSNYVDSSGIVLYYTKKTRPQDTGSLVIGQSDIAIPPKSPSFSVSSNGFKGSCGASRLTVYNRYNLTSMLFHMHKTGSYGKLTLTKNSTGKTMVLLDRDIVYDRPAMLIWKDSDVVELEPGDTLFIECRYNTMQRNEWTFYGERTQEEMCFAIFELYPLPGKKLSQATIDFGTIDSCTMWEKPVINNCTKADFQKLLSNAKTNKLGTFEGSCACSGTYPVPTCSSECYSFLNRTGFLAMPQCLNTSVMHILGITYDQPRRYNIQSQLAQCFKLATEPAPNTLCTAGATTARNSNNGSNGDQSLAPPGGSATALQPTHKYAIFAALFVVVLAKFGMRNAQ